MVMEGGLKIVTSVPCFNPKLMMDIYLFSPMPLPVNGELTLQIKPGQGRYLLINEDRSLFRTMTETEYNTCRSLGDFKYCDLHSVYFKSPVMANQDKFVERDEDICMLSLFTRKFATAKKTCDFTIGTNKKVIKQVGPQSFAVFSSTPDNGNIRCSGSTNDHQIISTGGLKTIQLGPGCRGETDEHIFASTDPLFRNPSDVKQISYDWPNYATDILEEFEISSSELKEGPVKEKLHNTHRSAMPLNEAKSLLQSIKKIIKAPIGSKIPALAQEIPKIAAKLPQIISEDDGSLFDDENLGNLISPIVSLAITLAGMAGIGVVVFKKIKGTPVATPAPVEYHPEKKPESEAVALGV